MDSRQVEYVLAVADERHFTHAAHRLLASQSTVSAGVRSLEQELGVRIFDRGPGGVRLTPEGETVLPALRALAEAEAHVRSAADPAGGLRGELRIGIFTNVGQLDFASIVGEFHRDHPLVDLRLSPSPSGSIGLAEDVQRGRLDLALFGLPASAAPGLRTHRLGTSPFVTILPADHRLAGADSVAVAELVGERFVDTPPGFGNRVVLETALAAHGLVRDVATEIGETGSIPAFVAAGLGIALLPSMIAPPFAGTVRVPLRERIDWEFNAITRERPRPAAAALLQRLIPHA